MIVFGGLVWLQLLVSVLVVLTLLALSGYSLYHAASTPAQAFEGTSKQSRNFWMALNTGAVVVALLALPPAQIIGFTFSLFGFVIPGVYLADVRPAVEPWRRRGGRGRGGRGHDGAGNGGPYGQRPPTNW